MISSSTDRPMTTRDEQRQARGDLVREVLEPGRVAADVDLAAACPASAAGITSSRRRRRAGRSSPRPAARSSGSAKIVAISPSWLTLRGRAPGHAGASPRRPPAARRAGPALSAPPFGMSTASRNGPLEPGPNACAEAVIGDALGACDVGWLPSSGWPRRSCVTGKAKMSRMSTPAAIETHGRAGDRSRPSARRRATAATCSGFFGAQPAARARRS